MRPLCGAIITAGALIGLGLTALAFGIRFQAFHDVNSETKAHFGVPSMMVSLVVLLLATGIGIGVAFLGLMFHHERRHRERLREMGHSPGAHTTV